MQTQGCLCTQERAALPAVTVSTSDPSVLGQESPDDLAAFAKSTVVTTSAPREMGSLRDADGKEGQNGNLSSKLAADVPAVPNGVDVKAH